MNYIGGKSKILPQLLPLFPSNIDTFHDIFTGGGNLPVNIESSNTYINDINNFVLEILEYFYSNNIEDILTEIYYYIDKFKLTKENIDGYNNCRTYYNSNKNCILLYTLVCYSFNYQFRFNSILQYNNAFGKNRSSFSDQLKNKLIIFVKKLQSKNINFYSLDFNDYFNSITFNNNDFVYCDPPYLITTGSYNDGKRGFCGWDSVLEKKLYDKLDSLSNMGIKFALSNVTIHKNNSNDILIKWMKNYNVHNINNNYSNSSYNTDKKSISQEVLITNY